MPLSHESTVSRTLVHRAAVAEVLLTDWQHTEPDVFHIAAQWPPGHVIYGASEGHFDPLLVAETIRQSGILIAHVGYGVPDGWSFVMGRLAFDCAPDHLQNVAGPLDLTAIVRISELVRKGSAVRGMKYDAQICHDGSPLGSGTAWARWIPPTAYERLRLGRRTASAPADPPVVTPADPKLVGRQRPDDVVVGTRDADGTHVLRVPLGHPIYFDHEVDHVPGMLTIEAMRQVALHDTSSHAAAVAGVDATFLSFVELDRNCTVTMKTLDRSSSGYVAHTQCVQDGAVTVYGDVTLLR